jgi:sulfur carrier protein ThiS
MKIELKNATNLEELRLKRNLEVELPESSTVGDLLSKLGLNRLKEGRSISSLVMLFKNKKAVRSVEEKLHDGDNLEIMPTVSGG